MTDNKQTSEKNDGSIYVWAGTFFVASAIIGFCVYVAVSQKKPAMEPAPPQAQVAPVQTQTPPSVPAPETEAAAPAEPAQPGPQPVPQAPPPEQQAHTGVPQLRLDNLAGTLRVEVPFLRVRDKIPLEHTCFRNNMSPALSWQDAPAGTQSYVVFLERRASGGQEASVNWILFNVPSDAGGVAQAQPREPVLPGGAKQAKGDAGTVGYIGPCDSKGSFTYALRVFALDTVLDLAPGIGKHDLIRAMNGHIIDAADREFTHYYRL